MVEEAITFNEKYPESIVAIDICAGEDPKYPPISFKQMY